MLINSQIHSLFLLLGSSLPALLVVLPRVPLVPQELGVHPFGGGVPVPPGLLDAVLVGLVGLVVGRVVLRLRHYETLRR